MGALALLARAPDGDATGHVHRMLAVASHRGTDTEVASIGDVTMGVCRQSEEDRTATAAGMARVGDHLVCVAGKVDNLADLGEPADGGATATAAALARLFQRHGEDLPARLRGIYAIAISDGRDVLAFRDHVGFKPLFHRTDGPRIVAATEAGQVAVGAGLPLAADLSVVADVFYDTYDDATPSAIHGVDRLPKATVLRGTRTRVSTRRYWRPADHLETAGRMTAGELQERFDDAMTTAVTRCLTGDDVVSLSGGIDSSVIAGYAAPVHARRYGRALGALSVVYPDQPAVDERRYVELLAEQLELELHLQRNETLGLDRLEDVTRLVGGPVPTVALLDMQRYYRHTRALGYRSIMVGEVAEFVIDVREGVVPHLVATGHPVEATRRLRRAGVRPIGLVRSIGATAVPRAVAAARARRRRMARVPDFLDARRVTTGAARRTPAPRHRYRQRQFAAFDGPGLSIEADEVIHDASGTQVRRPWIDVDLWELFLSLQPSQKYPAGRIRKALVRDLARGRVPDEVLDRTDKTVFNDAVMANVDYPGLRRWLQPGDFQMPGVDYAWLAARLEAQDLSLTEYVWASDLAVAHAFVRALHGRSVRA